MHCASCEVLIERKLKKLPGVQRVSVNRARGSAELKCHQAPDLETLQAALAPDGYRVSLWSSSEGKNEAPQNKRRHYIEIGGVALVLVAAYMVLQRFDLLPKGLSISDNMSYGVVFLIGLVPHVKLSPGAAARYVARRTFHFVPDAL